MTPDRSATATSGKSVCRSATARLATVASSIARNAAPEATASTTPDRAWARRETLGRGVLSIVGLRGSGRGEPDKTNERSCFLAEIERSCYFLLRRVDHHPGHR